jgi:hypothetical protein
MLEVDKMLKAYLARANEIIGERTPSEIAHDDVVIESLNSGLSIESALANAARQYPNEKLEWNSGNIDEISSHYEYIKEHTSIMKELKKSKFK